MCRGLGLGLEVGVWGVVFGVYGMGFSVGGLVEGEGLPPSQRCVAVPRKARI